MTKRRGVTANLVIVDEATHYEPAADDVDELGDLGVPVIVEGQVVGHQDPIFPLDLPMRNGSTQP
ncbi:hypothetical protein [Streptosporangium sp. OZ121]|uniref:hypothetical protein n=1 Tax=Streptosporangium sp. OZ121 TaxID=3444183 RepID=UPI003F78D097